MKLTLHELIKIFEIVIQYFNQQGVKKISFVAEDYYPQVLRKDLDFDNPDFLKCPHFLLGSLDWNFEVWKGILKEKEEGVYEISGGIIDYLGGILTAFGQVSDKLDNPTFIKNIPFEGQRPQLTLDELQKIFDLTIQAIKR